MFSLRQRLRIPADASVRITYWTTIASSRDVIRDLVDRHRAPNAFSRASLLAWTQSQVQLRQIGTTAHEAALFQRLAGHLLFASASMRPAPELIERGAGGPAGLWSQGISGDLPILLVRIDDPEDLRFVRELLKAHEYWRTKAFAVDLVILNERAPSYVQDLQTALSTATRTGGTPASPSGGGGGVFVLRSDLLPPEHGLCSHLPQEWFCTRRTATWATNWIWPMVTLRFIPYSRSHPIEIDPRRRLSLSIPPNLSTTTVLVVCRCRS